ncbi:hypothetical protein SLA2020_433620, partial [Shorea laevis]
MCRRCRPGSTAPASSPSLPHRQTATSPPSSQMCQPPQT